MPLRPIRSPRPIHHPRIHTPHITPFPLRMHMRCSIGARRLDEDLRRCTCPVTDRWLLEAASGAGTEGGDCYVIR
eukprot:6289126-Pyramimonas_sp.AAC.2